MSERKTAGETRTTLRRATAAIHDELHGEPAFAALGRGEIDAAGYRALLRQLYGFHAPLDRILLRMAGQASPLIDALDLPARRKLPLLEADLRSLGEASLDAIPRHQILVEPATPAELMGCLYVVEGSTLGGRLLARGLDGLLGDRSAPDGRRYLLGYGDGHGAMWGRFCGLLETAGADLRQRREIVASAIATFAEFRAWLRGPVVQPSLPVAAAGS